MTPFRSHSDSQDSSPGLWDPRACVPNPDLQALEHQEETSAEGQVWALPLVMGGTGGQSSELQEPGDPTEHPFQASEAYCL